RFSRDWSSDVCSSDLPPGSLRWRTLQLPSRVIASAFLATIGLVLIIGCLAEPAPPQTSPAREAETTPAVSQVESTVPDEAAEPPGVLTTQGADGAVRLSPLRSEEHTSELSHVKI